MRKKGILREYNGDEITDLPTEVYTPIVDSIINQGDMVIMSGNPKSNKSTFAMQLASAVSCGKPFLGTFKVPVARKVWYFSTEGKDVEFRERIVRMKHAVHVNLDNLFLFCSTQFKVNTLEGKKILDKLVEKYKDDLPDLIIVDSLYSSFFGKLAEDDVVNGYITILRNLSELCNNAAVFLFHHNKKPSRDYKGNWMLTTDADSYGSAFFAGQADHLFRIEVGTKDKMTRVIFCDTQRSSRIIERIDLKLNEPDPFFLSIIGCHDAEHEEVVRLLRKYSNGLKGSEIIKMTSMGKSVCYMVLNELINSNRIQKEGHGGVYTTK